MKRILCCLICFCMLFSLVSCDIGFKPNEEEPTTEEYVTTKKPSREEPEEDEEDKEEDEEDKEEDEEDEEDETETTGSSTEKGEIKIGLSGPLTGPASVYGIAVKNSAQLAVDEINAAGGLDGIRLQLCAVDDKHDATKIAENYATLTDWGMQVSLGCVTSAPCLKFAELAKEDNLFFLTPSASHNDVVKYDNAYQMCFEDANQGTAVANYVNRLDYTTIGILYQSDNSYITGIYDNFKAALDEDITTVEASFVGDNTNFTSQIEVLRDCEFIFMPTYYTSAVYFMAQAKGQIADDAIYFGCDGFDGIEYSNVVDLDTIPQKIMMLSNFNIKATDGVAGDFIKKYGETFGTETFTQFGALAYDSVYAIFNAMKEAKADGKDINPSMSASELCEILKAEFNGGFTYSGVTDDAIKWQSSGLAVKTGVALVIKDFS